MNTTEYQWVFEIVFLSFFILFSTLIRNCIFLVSLNKNSASSTRTQRIELLQMTIYVRGC